MNNIHLLFGEEAYLLEEKKANIIKNFLPPEEIEFGVSIHDMKETPLSVAIEDAQTLSFLGGNRVILLKDCSFLTSEKAKGSVEHDLDELIHYIDHPNDSAILLMMVHSEKLDARKKVVKLLKKSSEVSIYEAKPLKNNQLFDWVLDYSRKVNVSITNETINLLIQSIGSNLLLLEQELAKMALYVGSQGEINKEVAEALMSRTLEQDIFKLIESVVNKNMSKAYDILDDMFRQGEDPIKIVNLISRQIRIIYQTKTLKGNGLRESDIASKLKLHPFVVQIAGQQSKHYESNVLVGLLSQLSTLDNQMKTGQVDKHLALETFLTTI
ncbi:DNA polymerase III subunit delta [Peribacillus asahii]|uniref:DNA polymerase III subunit delta n=1 Tax=Peribacillus asahii TaxID=228899 RepID=UPI00207AF435|nr:DNA polymerase III subunit delta [Peribacillus asahii]USK62347.1 DNA polymerase III subunit delta [Peribacillus asahii]